MTKLRWIAAFYALALLFAASLNYIPGLTDAEGRSFGIFALDMYDDLLHLASALWAGIAAYVGQKATRSFLAYFGILYFADGFMGLVTGSGYLDLGIINYGFVDLPFTFKIMANMPHLALGGIAILSAVLVDRKVAA